MKPIGTRPIRIFLSSILPSAAIFITHAADTNPPPRLTVELRDGSRVVGESVGKNFRFHSALLGDFKLDVPAVRTLEFVSTNCTRLTTTNGDTLAVSLLDQSIPARTGFGKVELTADSIRKISVAVSGTAPTRHPGLVSLWSGEGNAGDSVGGNNGTLVGNVAYGPGKFGQGFVLDGQGGGVLLGNPPGLELQDFTIEMWLKRANDSAVSYANCGHACLFGTGWGGYFLFLTQDGHLLFDRLGDAVPQQGPFITDTEFHHVALTKTGTTTVFYLDGKAFPVPAYATRFDFTTPIGFGFFAEGQDQSFLGTLDEIAFYNRALSADEISQDFEAGK